jgi:uncharacterized protein YnzC (UPF0291/DUF896 family)
MTHQDTSPLSRHIVGFPDAIPNMWWMADRMLWSNSFGVIWPGSEPTPKGDVEEEALSAARLYRDNGFFDECVVDHDAFAAKNLRALSHSPDAIREWIARFPGDHGAEDVHFPNPKDAYFYINKLGEEVADELVVANLAIRDKDGFGVRLKSRAQAAHLMSAVAGFARSESRPNAAITLDAASNRAFARAAAPLEEDEGCPAAVMTLPIIGGEGDPPTPQKLVEFRRNQRNEDARKEYLDALHAHVQAQVERLGGAADPARMAAQQIRDDLNGAMMTFAQRVKRGLSLQAVTVAAAPVAIPLLVGTTDLTAAATGAASSAAVGMLKLRSSSPPYLRRVKGAGVLAWS